MVFQSKYLDIAPSASQGQARPSFPARRPAQEGRDIDDSEQRKSAWPLVWFLTLALALLVGLVVVAGRSFQKASIKVWQNYKNLTISENLEVKVPGVGPEQIVSTKLTLPAVVLEKEQKATQTFEASFVDKEQRAEGKIVVYNNYSATPLNFVAGTRFLSEQGKLFRAKHKIFIPGKTKQGNETVPGKVEVEVAAAAAGPEYNIGPAKFSLPGLAGTALYTLVFAESSAPIAGGFKGQGRLILKDDALSAYQTLTKKMESDNLAQLTKEHTQKFVILPETAEHVVKEKSSAPQVGEAADNFEAQLLLSTKVLAIPKDKLDKFVQDRLAKEITAGRKIWPEHLKVELEVKEGSVKSASALVVGRVQARVSEALDVAVLKGELAGKSRSEAQFLLQERFAKSEIELSPFWASRIPDSTERIDLSILLD